MKRFDIISEKGICMKKITIVVLLMSLGMIMSGCSKTWSGVKQDTNSAWNASKKAVHEATA